MLDAQYRMIEYAYKRYREGKAFITIVFMVDGCVKNEDVFDYEELDFQNNIETWLADGSAWRRHIRMMVQDYEPITGPAIAVYMGTMSDIEQSEAIAYWRSLADKEVTK